MSLRKDIERFRLKVERAKKAAREFTERNVQIACDEMKLKAKEETPPHSGQERGLNTVTGNMAAHWQASYNFSDNDCTVRLSNDVQYASYVENGHRMDKHFVPWLYIDDSGLLSRRIPEPGEPLFGLVVGTKTTYVPPEHICQQAKERFFKVFNGLQSGIVSVIETELNQ